jgi:hypothetical protein
MPFPNVGEWEYNLGGRDYLIQWKHKATGQMVEIEPNEDQDREDSFDPGKMEWEGEWSNEGNTVDLGYGTEHQMWLMVKWFMERYPNGLPEEVRKKPHLLNQMMREIEGVVPKRRVPNQTVTKPRKKTPSRRPRLSR